MSDKDKQKISSESKTTVFGTSSVSSRGQIVVPAKLREAQNIKTGDTLIFTGSPNSKHFTILNAKAFEGFTRDLEALLNGDKISQKKGRKG